MRENKDLWKFFNNNVEKGIAICKICSTRLKNNRTFNLKAHLRKVHRVNINDEHLNASGPTIIRKKKFKIEVDKKAIFRSYIGLVIDDSVPFDVLNSANMRAFIEPICEGLGAGREKKIRLNSENCRTTIKQLGDNIKKDISYELKSRLLSIRIDSATGLAPNIFGISAQFIAEDEITSRILGMVKVEGTRHLATEILKTLCNYEISLNQIVSITSDIDASRTKNTKSVLHCSSMEDWNEDDAEALNDAYMQNINSFDDFPDIHVEEKQICSFAAHIAQLCALDVTKNAEIKKYILDCRNLAMFCRKNLSGCRDILELNNIRIPQLDWPTSWGSTYNMLHELKQAKTILGIVKLEPTTNTSAEEYLRNNDTLWDFIESYCIVFDPMQKTIAKFQEEHLHYGDFYAQWLKCKIYTKKIVDSAKNKRSFTYKIGSSLLQAIENRSQKLMCNESLLATLFLDPRFQHTLTPAQKSDGISYLKMLWKKLKSQNDQDMQASTTKSSPSGNDTDDNIDEEDALLNEFLASGMHATQTNDATTVYAKIERLQLPFMRSDTNVLQFWKEKVYSDTELYALSEICFAIPATQMTMERLFSTLKMPLTENRNAFSEDSLEDILLVKLNPSYLDDAINNLPLFEEDESMDKTLKKIM